MLVLNIKYKNELDDRAATAALLVGVLAGMDLTMLLHTIKVGFGSTLGELAIIVVFGAVIGKLMVDLGAAHRIAGDAALPLRPEVRPVRRDRDRLDLRAGDVL